MTGPKNIGVRELTYRMAFLASSVQVCSTPEMGSQACGSFSAI